MTILFAIIGGIIGVVVINFIIDKNKQSSKIFAEGGMLNKYKTLIEGIKSQDPRARIFHVSSDSVSLGLTNAGGISKFLIIETFGKVTVTWNLESPVFGKHKMEWDFNESSDQDNMLREISGGLGAYQLKFMAGGV